MWWSVLKVWKTESNWTHFVDNLKKARLNEAVSVVSISGTTAFSHFKAEAVWITLKAALYVYCIASAKLIICAEDEWSNHKEAACRMPSDIPASNVSTVLLFWRLVVQMRPKKQWPISFLTKSHSKTHYLSTCTTCLAGFLVRNACSAPNIKFK